MMTREGHDRQQNRNAALALLLGLALTLAAGQALAREVQAVTGLRATIHTADEIRDRWLEGAGERRTLVHPAIGRLELAPASPADTALVPVDADRVAAALSAVQGFEADLHVHVFLLPAMPEIVASSFARRDAIFMAPKFGRPADAPLAYEVIHELGHVLCWAAVDGRPDRWREYRDLRGLDPQPDPGRLPHAERNREIIAEDFRALFGGAVAANGGRIENPRLPRPATVHGLRGLLAEFLASASTTTDHLRPSLVYPNPCRESARVELSLSSAAGKGLASRAVLEIYDLRGRLVRRVTGERSANGRATAIWDGAGADGRRVASGLYLYRIRAGAETGTGRLLLVDR
jgi:hypothetical protein